MVAAIGLINERVVNRWVTGARGLDGDAAKRPRVDAYCGAARREGVIRGSCAVYRGSVDGEILPQPPLPT